MKLAKLKLDKHTSWQIIFINSRANGGTYVGDYLPQQRRIWPTKTYLQTRLAQLKEQEKNPQ